MSTLGIPPPLILERLHSYEGKRKAKEEEKIKRIESQISYIFSSSSLWFRDVLRIFTAPTMAQPLCYSGSEVLFECGGAYAGACNTTSGSCLCFPGWSSQSDVIQMGHRARVLSCPIHLATLKVLWGFVLAPLASCIYVYPSCFKTAWGTYLRKRSDDPLQYMIICAMAIFGPISLSSLLALVILKLADIDGTALVGIHVVPTSLFALTTFCFIFMFTVTTLRSLKGAIAGAVHLPSSTPVGGDRRSQSQKKIHQLYAVVLGVTVPCMFQDVPLLISVAYPSEIPVDGAPLDAKRVAAATWVYVQLLAIVAGGALSWYTQRAVAGFFRPILQFSTSMDDSTRLRVTTLRNSAVEAHRGLVRNCFVMLFVGLVVRVPTPWWTATQSYWLPISKCLQAINVYRALRVFTTKRVTAMTSRGGDATTGSTRPDMTGGELVSIAPTTETVT